MIRVADPVTTGVSNRLETTDHNSYMAGMGDGTFRPNEAVTRAQAATIVNAMLKRFADKDYVKGKIQNPYNDVTDAHWLSIRYWKQAWRMTMIMMRAEWSFGTV